MNVHITDLVFFLSSSRDDFNFCTCGIGNNWNFVIFSIDLNTV